MNEKQKRLANLILLPAMFFVSLCTLPIYAILDFQTSINILIAEMTGLTVVVACVAIRIVRIAKR